MDVHIDGYTALVVRDGPTWVGWIGALGVNRNADSFEEVLDLLGDAIRHGAHKPLAHASVAARMA